MELRANVAGLVFVPPIESVGGSQIGGDMHMIRTPSEYNASESRDMLVDWQICIDWAIQVTVSTVLRILYL